MFEFDFLWKKGLGELGHAGQTDRYVVLLYRNMILYNTIPFGTYDSFK